ncbi:hypothetical protein [Lacticaseibacillus saniviri]|uniref:GyrI-like small molecule binding domain-containing protein n=1 Tax=Lacticaseibacillus saniviri JCM 17471 = DSM 24301 TaxID=1293598 RepID=A0A0R2MXT0_9LACO|nr:hypothetical protein [Lacticaseibacillus saniviri]KRO16419.1 hypothetical protein IV56_GL001201 [Lacticaseibacillus saniviri JCM 17471 = DSM 24301]MCG4282878.1 hypothetical protein [Lacticaseibacillus saniviri]
MFDWRVNEAEEYSRDAQLSFVNLTTRSYLTVSGDAPEQTADSAFLGAAQALEQLATLISQGPEHGIEIGGFKAYHPYPVQAVWSGGSDAATQTHFKLWLKQPLFINQKIFDAAIKQLNSTLPIAFEQLAEGVEIQTAGTNAQRQEALTRLQKGIEARELVRVDPNQHREVYLDGVSPIETVLYRVEVQPNRGQIDRDNMAYN